MKARNWDASNSQTKVWELVSSGHERDSGPPLQGLCASVGPCIPTVDT